MAEKTIPLTQHHITVLLVDDQASIGEAIRRMVSTEPDIEFHYCQNPVHAIKIAKQIAPTVILQDLVMPEIDGLKLVQYFRANPATRDVPLIVLSVREDAAIKAEAFALGANDYMEKFPDRMEVIARIRYHSKAYITLLQKNEAYEKLSLSMKKEQQLRETLESESIHDPLTGLYNRRCIEHELEREMADAAQHDSHVGLIMLDIDHFRTLNGTYGHKAGDQILQQVGQYLKQQVQDDNVLSCRYGDGEFLLICPGHTCSELLQQAESLRQGVKEHVTVASHQDTVTITVSSGVACFPEHGSTIHDLLQAADLAVYQAKSGGRDRVELASGSDI